MWDGRVYASCWSWNLFKTPDGDIRLVALQKLPRGEYSYAVIFIIGLIVAFAALVGFERTPNTIAFAVLSVCITFLATAAIFVYRILEIRAEWKRGEVILEVFPDFSIELPRDQVSYPSDAKVSIEIVCDAPPGKFFRLQGGGRQQFTEVNLQVDWSGNVSRHGLIGGGGSYDDIRHFARQLSNLTGWSLVRVGRLPGALPVDESDIV